MQTACKHCPTASREEGTAPLQQMCPDCAAGPGWQAPWLRMLARRRPAGKPCAGRSAWALTPARRRPLCSTKPISACRPSTGPSSDNMLPCNERQALLYVSARPCPPCAPSCYLTQWTVLCCIRVCASTEARLPHSSWAATTVSPKLAHVPVSVHTWLCSEAAGLGSRSGLLRGLFWRCSALSFSLTRPAAASQWLLEGDRLHSREGCAPVNQDLGPRRGCLSHERRACAQHHASMS